MSETRAFGSWPSPLTAADVTAATPRIDGARFVGDEVWWGEGVPEEGGRTAVRRRGADGAIDDVLPAPWNARSRVHEYGGGSWTTTDEGTLLFVEKADQCVWALEPGTEPRTLTPAEHGMRFGGLTWQNGELLAIREAHDGSLVPHRSIVRIALDGSGVTAIVDESDFLAQPALSPSGRHIAWIAWNHPDMPWDRSELRVGRLEAGIVVEWTAVAGEGSAPLQPVWIDDDDLLYADDSTGRWNLWREHLSADLERHAVAPADADTGGPLWVLGTRWFGRLADGRIVAVRTNGDDELVLIETDGTVTPLPASVTTEVCVEDVQGTRVLVSGASSDSPSALWAIDVDHPEAAELIHGGPPEWGSEWMPRPRAVTFDGPTGPVHAFDYPPTNPVVAAPEGEQPPYLISVHGGPTTHRGGAASGRIAYFTSRGIGVLDVNYGGSSGYGRAYRERLRGQWGVVDVQDVATAASALATTGAADAARLTVAGGSAGGWTVLAALVGTDVFTAGISRYGVGDARALATDTHDFEARYLDGLIGPLPAAEKLYIERSPLSHPERFRVPLLLLQGAEDPVVPPAQSEAIRDALAAHGIPHAYVVYEGEGHGFRRAENVINALETELAFLGAVFGFDTPGVPPLALS
jgi:dipeptidyl aminopeptidase/acylaminoacyl peptidase